MTDSEALRARRLGGEVLAAIGFYTRLPVPAPAVSFAAAQWAAPLAGAVVGLVSGLVLAGASWLGIPAVVAAAMALGVAMLVTGGLHEDGLADVADGFGGGRNREEKLAIMRDSRVGTFGVLALLVAVLVRWAALTALAGAGAWAALLALVAAHAASRALLPLFMVLVPPARTDGLSAGTGRIGRATALGALAVGGLALAACGPGLALSAAVLLGVWFLALARLCRRQIGGQTGDVLGTLQQGGEAAVLIAASATFT
ncbi:adenosylcobinamide-GDP ribazoletransferase [Chelativorans intermedius]|uniref:Adenosylcobinamide-GDP ribazoletransferase n=1 Tax=Chelativorans intermedius TaxID=515947 RepID=A0ABV6D5C6_9HYPH|nr:adenosylcobinamide-GDP ribazoletransferase [Chelativorans intermedius]MCT8997100.1 adenosylcobinamide-GDP ribazoletransferase [Chelativorans intermedius]